MEIKVTWKQVRVRNVKGSDAEPFVATSEKRAKNNEGTA